MRMFGSVAAFETARRSAVSAKVVVAFTGAGATEG